VLIRWLHSRFCTESPDQSIHYEEIATERNDQFESNSSTGHPERRNGFFVPEHDFSPINTSPHSLQEKKDHAFSYPIRSQGFSKEAHRMIYERPNGETPVYSSIRKAKLCKFNDIDSQAEENSSQPKECHLAEVTREMSEASKKHVVAVEINTEQNSTITSSV
jgi:hypothetical protein